MFSGENISHYDPEHGYIEMTTPIMDTTANTTDENGKRNPDAIRGVMLTSISNDSIVNAKEVLNRKAYILEVIMMVAILALAIILSRALTRPFNRVTQAINAVKEGFSDETISVPDYVETVHIVDAFNQLLKRMKALDDSRQEFVANVSHELKTPMTSIKVLSDSLLAQENVPAELYREFMEDIASEIDRENQIITDLLALVKMDKKVQDLNIVSLNINDLTELILKRLRPIARKKDVEVVFESVRPVVAEVDEVKMTLIMTNLVENAIKYNKDHGWVKVILDADHQYFTFEVVIPESVSRGGSGTYLRENSTCGQVSFQRDRRNGTGTGDHQERRPDAQGIPYGDEYRGAGLLFPGEDPADIYRLLDGAVVRKIV